MESFLVSTNDKRAFRKVKETIPRAKIDLQSKKVFAEEQTEGFPSKRYMPLLKRLDIDKFANDLLLSLVPTCEGPEHSDDTPCSVKLDLKTRVLLMEPV